MSLGEGEEQGGERELVGIFSVEGRVEVQDNGVNPSPLHVHPAISARKTWS